VKPCCARIAACRSSPTVQPAVPGSITTVGCGPVPAASYFSTVNCEPSGAAIVQKVDGPAGLAPRGRAAGRGGAALLGAMGVAVGMMGGTERGTVVGPRRIRAALVVWDRVAPARVAVAQTAPKRNSTRISARTRLTPRRAVPPTCSRPPTSRFFPVRSSWAWQIAKIRPAAASPGPSAARLLGPAGGDARRLPGHLRVDGGPRRILQPGGPITLVHREEGLE
jgi:hypothetical protein